MNRSANRSTNPPANRPAPLAIPGPVRRPAAAAALALAALSGCECQGDPASEPEPPPVPEGVTVGGWYRAEIAAEDAPPIPFFLKLPADAGAPGALVNGDQRLAIEPDRHRWLGARAEIAFPLYRTRIEATAGEGGALTGTFTSEAKAFGDTSLSLAAEPVERPAPAARFPAPEDGAAPPDSLPEVWRLALADSGTARLSLSTDGAAASAWIRFESGNTIFLAGTARGDRLRLSAFDGSSPYLLDATITGEGRLEGRWLAGAGLDWREELTGEAGTFELRERPALADGSRRVEIPELNVPRYEDTPVILVLTGSWHPAVRYAAPLWNEIYGAYHPRGLEMLTLVYEFTDDESYNAEQAARLESAYDIPWKVVPVRGTVDEFWDILPVGLEGISPQSFPVAVFMDRYGTVHDVRAGFPAEEAAARHEAVAGAYRELAEKIVAAGQP